jgi:hypothetical protein
MAVMLGGEHLAIAIVTSDRSGCLQPGCRLIMLVQVLPVADSVCALMVHHELFRYLE